MADCFFLNHQNMMSTGQRRKILIIMAWTGQATGQAAGREVSWVITMVDAVVCRDVIKFM